MPLLLVAGGAALLMGGGGVYLAGDGVESASNGASKLAVAALVGGAGYLYLKKKGVV